MTKSLQLADALLTRAILLNRVSSGMVQQIDEALPRLRGAIIAELVTTTRPAGVFVPLLVSATFDKMGEYVLGSFNSIMRSQVDFTQETLSRILDRLVFVPLSADFGLPEVMGAPLSRWIANFRAHLEFQSLAAIRVVSSTATPSIDPDFLLKEFNQVSAGIDALIRTATVKVADHALREIAKFSLARGSYRWVHLSVLDNRTSKTCIDYSAKEWNSEFEPIGHDLPFNDGTPRHFNCRSITAIAFEDDSLNIDIDDWLAMKSESEQAKLFGKAQMRLWNRKLLPLSGLVRQVNRPLPIASLVTSQR